VGGEDVREPFIGSGGSVVAGCRRGTGAGGGAP
jgi:hypothetical protein